MNLLFCFISANSLELIRWAYNLFKGSRMSYYIKRRLDAYPIVMTGYTLLFFMIYLICELLIFIFESLAALCQLI